MKGIIYTISNRYYETLCNMLNTKDENKIIDYLNKKENLKQNITKINIKKAVKLPF